MKILFITSHITHPSSPVFMRNQTGFGYMVFDIAKNMSKYNDVDIFIANTFSSNLQIEGVNIIGRTWLTYFCGLSLRNISNGIKFIRKYRLPLKRSLRELYMYTSLSQIRSKLKDYDVVHIHGCSEITDGMIRMCKYQKVPFVVTLHGLNSFEDKIKLPRSLKRYEQDFLKEAASQDYSVSFISTGNKETAEVFVGKKVKTFKVICNGCDVNEQSATIDVRKKYNISKDDFLFVFVGNVSANKNQLQVARAWQKLPEEQKNHCKVLFVGRCFESDEIVSFIKKNKLNNSLIMCGMQPKDEVFNYYIAANATILTSLTEGFGLSIIEGYVYGKPNITFSDLPAIADVFNDHTMVAVKDRSDESLANAIVSMMNKSYHCEFIKSFAKRFSYDNMIKQYISFYKSVII